MRWSVYFIAIPQSASGYKGTVITLICVCTVHTYGIWNATAMVADKFHLTILVVDWFSAISDKCRWRLWNHLCRVVVINLGRVFIMKKSSLSSDRQGNPATDRIEIYSMEIQIIIKGQLQQQVHRLAKIGVWSIFNSKNLTWTTSLSYYFWSMSKYWFVYFSSLLNKMVHWLDSKDLGASGELYYKFAF